MPSVAPSLPPMFWMTPPVQSAATGAAEGDTRPPQSPLELPVTAKLPAVLARTMPLAQLLRDAVPAETLVKLAAIAAVPLPGFRLMAAVQAALALVALTLTSLVVRLLKLVPLNAVPP